MAAHAIACGTGCSPVVHTLAALVLPAHLIHDLRLCQARPSERLAIFAAASPPTSLARHYVITAFSIVARHMVLSQRSERLTSCHPTLHPSALQQPPAHVPANLADGALQPALPVLHAGGGRAADAQQQAADDRGDHAAGGLRRSMHVSHVAFGHVGPAGGNRWAILTA